MWYGPTGSSRCGKKLGLDITNSGETPRGLCKALMSTAAILTFPLAVSTESVGDLYSLIPLSQKCWCNCRNTSLSKSVMQSKIAVHVTVSVVGVLRDNCNTTEPHCALDVLNHGRQLTICTKIKP